MAVDNKMIKSEVMAHQKKTKWPLRRLGEICQTGSGGTPLKARKDYYENGTIPWLQSGEVGQGEVWSTINLITQKGLESSAAKIFPRDTILVAMYGATAGQVGILKIEAATNQAVCGILPNKNFIQKFLFYFMLFKKDKLAAQATGNAQPNISQEKIRNIIIPVFSMTEQLRIVTILDEAFTDITIAKANAEKNLQNAQALFDSHLQSVFTQRGEGWTEKVIEEIAEHSLGKMLDKSKNKGKPQPYLRNINVRWFKFDLSDLLEMRFLDDESTKYTAVKGDVLICEGGYPGRAAIWDENYAIHFQKALHRVRFHEPQYSKWFVYFLYAQDRNGELQNYFTGTGIQHFTGEALSRFKIPIAPLPKMRQLLTSIEKLSTETQRLEAIYQKKLAALEELRQSLLHQAFNGEL